MTDVQQREAARQFYYKSNGKGKEDEAACVAWLMRLYQEKVAELEKATSARSGKAGEK